MFENWTDIITHKGLYQISDLGRVRNHRGRILKGYTNNKGYKMVHLRTKDSNKLYSIHRLVAIHFIPNPDNLPCVNHKDENKANNRANNLEWCTHNYNINYGTGNKRRSKTKINNTYNTKAVRCVELKKTFASTREAQRKTGIDCSQISAVCNHKKNYKTAGGYHWHYVERRIKNENSR